MARTPSLKLKRNSSTKSKSTNSTWSKIKNHSFGQSRAYIFEYGFLLLLLGVLVGTMVVMTQKIIEGIGASAEDSYLAGLEYNMSLTLLSTLIVVLPLVYVLIQRTAEAEAVQPTIKNNAWRKGFLGVFLTAFCITALYYAVQFVNTFVSYIANDEQQFEWQRSLSLAVVLLLVVTTAWIFGQDYRLVKENRYAKWAHYYRYSILLIPLIIAVLFIAFPLDALGDAADNHQESFSCEGEAIQEKELDYHHYQEHSQEIQSLPMY